MKGGEFRVWGTPRPGGSKRAFKHFHTGKIVVVEDCRENKTWRELVAISCQEHVSRSLWPEAFPLEEPIMISVRFDMKRPKRHFRTGKYRGEVKESAPEWHSCRPDATKLMRSTEDALTGILVKDDSLIVYQSVQKVYAMSEGCTVKYATADAWDGDKSRMWLLDYIRGEA